MSNAVTIAPLLEGIRSAIVAAWPAMPISYGQLRMPLHQVPHAIVLWDRVTIDFKGTGASLRRPSQRNSFTILGRFPFPEDATQWIALEQVARANELIALLQASPEFAGIGVLPLVTEVRPQTQFSDDQTYEVTLIFEVTTTASHGAT